MKDVIKSILLTAVVATFIGAGIHIVFECSIVKSIVVCVFIQIIFFMVYNNIMVRMNNIAIEKETTKQISLLSRQDAELQCAHCNTVNSVPIEIANDNVFECAECGEGNAVYISITTAQKANILDVDRLQVSTLIEEELKAKNNFLD